MTLCSAYCTARNTADSLSCSDAHVVPREDNDTRGVPRASRAGVAAAAAPHCTPQRRLTLSTLSRYASCAGSLGSFECDVGACVTPDPAPKRVVATSSGGQYSSRNGFIESRAVKRSWRRSAIRRSSTSSCECSSPIQQRSRPAKHALAARVCGLRRHVSRISSSAAHREGAHTASWTWPLRPPRICRERGRRRSDAL
jgi:hypothetical protein